MYIYMTLSQASLDKTTPRSAVIRLLPNIITFMQESCVPYPFTGINSYYGISLSR